VSLVIHAKELKRTTNSGTLAVKALTNSQMYVRGDSTERLDLSAILDESYRSVLFYPSADAIELDAAFMREDPRPVHLIVPDGNWRQASKVHHRHTELKHLPRVMIKSPNVEKMHLRAESTPEGMATLQAIAHAIGVTENEAAKSELLTLYRLKLERTLQGRGTLQK
jgi:DTW domain-containing protein YfiP